MDKIKNELYEDVYKQKFSFGENWTNYLKKVDSNRISIAKESLTRLLEYKDFKEKIFLDFGCGSGIFSLAAIKLGAKKVISVDIDDNSINCAKSLRKKYKISSDKWIIKKGSALDKDFLLKLPKSDIVYSWGVLHHTGKMWTALDNITIPLKENGILYMAIYNDFRGFPFSSETWKKIKKIYSTSKNKPLKRAMELGWSAVVIMGLIAYGRNPVSYVKNYDKKSARGMDFQTDIVDWLGGYPFEYASEQKICSFYRKKKLKLINKKITKREGCNEFVFASADASDKTVKK